MVLLGTSPTSFLGEVHFFFSGLPAGPTYRPLVRHSNPDAPLKVKGDNNVHVHSLGGEKIQKYFFADHRF